MQYRMNSKRLDLKSARIWIVGFSLFFCEKRGERRENSITCGEMVLKDVGKKSSEVHCRGKIHLRPLWNLGKVWPIKILHCITQLVVNLLDTAWRQALVKNIQQGRGKAWFQVGNIIRNLPNWFVCLFGFGFGFGFGFAYMDRMEFSQREKFQISPQFLSFLNFFSLGLKAPGFLPSGLGLDDEDGRCQSSIRQNCLSRHRSPCNRNQHCGFWLWLSHSLAGDRSGQTQFHQQPESRL